MSAYVLRRCGQFIPVLLLGAVAVWAMIYALPGSPAALLAGDNATKEQVAAISSRLRLDRPVWEQFGAWIEHAAQGDLGTSFISGLSVAELLGRSIPATAQLAVLTMILIVALAIPLGTAVAVRPDHWLTRWLRSWLAVSLATPGFWLGLLLILLFSVELRLLPAASVYEPAWRHPFSALEHTILPALALAVPASSVTARFVAASVEEAMDSDFVRTARAKGASESRVLLRHAMPNALLPIVTILGLQLGAFLGGAIVIEVVFTYPGLGWLLYTAINNRDYAVVQGAVLFIVVVFLVLNLLIDLLYAYLDPRVRLS